MTCKLTTAERKELEALIETFINARDDLHNWLHSCVDEWQQEIDAMSERWQESDAGQAARARLDELIIVADEVEGCNPDFSLTP